MSQRKKPKARALHDYQAQDASQISFSKGAIITVIKKDTGSGWWAGEINGKVGYFPPSYVEILRSGGPGGSGGSAGAGSARSGTTLKTKGGTRVPKPQHAPPEKKPGFQARAQWDYRAEDKKELSFREGDVLFVIDTRDGGWWLAMLGGKKGLVPSNYLKRV